MTEFTITNVEQNNNGTVNITGEDNKGRTVTMFNAYPTEYHGRGEPITYEQITIHMPYVWTIETPDKQWRKDFGQL